MKQSLVIVIAIVIAIVIVIDDLDSSHKDWSTGSEVESVHLECRLRQEE